MMNPNQGRRGDRDNVLGESWFILSEQPQSGATNITFVSSMDDKDISNASARAIQIVTTKSVCPPPPNLYHGQGLEQSIREPAGHNRNRR